LEALNYVGAAVVFPPVDNKWACACHPNFAGLTGHSSVRHHFLVHGELAALVGAAVAAVWLTQELAHRHLPYRFGRTFLSLSRLKNGERAE
jgi:hypothetical protein